jgi:hypothetical protein
LEDRTTPTATAVTGNFNGTALAAGDNLWFSSVGKVSGLGTTPTTLHVTSGTISFTAGGTAYTVAVPDATITFTQLATQATTTYTSGGGWQVTAPTRFSGNVFLGGVPVPLPAGLPGGVKNVTWAADVSADTGGLKVNWQWAAGAYTSFGDPAGLGVKTVDDGRLDAYSNSDHAGTPEAFKRFVVGGATGGGGSNFTGSYSATKAVFPDLTAPPTGLASLSGTVYLDTSAPGTEGFHVIDPADAPLAGAIVTLRDGNGNLVASLTTGDDGTFSFGNLAAGTYSVDVRITGINAVSMFPDIGGVASGTPDGNVDSSWMVITDIQLGAGEAGTGYHFGVWQSGS